MYLTEKRVNRFIVKNYKYKSYDYEILGKEKKDGALYHKAKVKIQTLDDNFCFYILIPEDVTKKIKIA